VTLTDNFDPDIVACVLRYRADIEYNLGVIVYTIDTQDCLVIKGDNSDVKVVDQLLDLLENWVSDDKELKDFSVQETLRQCIIENDPDIKDLVFFGKTNVSQNNSKSDHDEVNIATKTPESKENSNTSLQKSFKGLSVKPSKKALAKSKSASFTDEEDIINDIRNSVEYKANIEFALKLGYNETDLINALRTLGRNASQNELLSELIKCYTPAEISESLGASLGGGDSSLSLSGLQLAGEDSGPYRHIIMDGSNLAMRWVGNVVSFLLYVMLYYTYR